jgi:eukaryotic-like serine/threonine-protein kinase
MIGRLVDGRYQVRSRIARGGMATVYLATDLRLERRVAIKIMHGHLADDNTFKTRFVQEARSAARLAHPNVVNVFDQGQDSDMAYLVMEYLPGITLRELLKDYQKLTPEQTVDIMDAVLAGLAAAHKAGIVHRDLKPENVLLADDGRIKLGDFGLARAASANTATGQALLGTIAYLSPELVTRGVADARSDIYAVGIMMYEMLTGEQPYVGEAPMAIAYQHANDTVPTPSTKNPSVPVELDELVLWATARDPEERPHDAREMLERLREAEPSIRSRSMVRPTQATVAIPDSALAVGAATAETPILGGGGPVVTTATLPAPDDVGEDVTALVSSAERRKRRGYWIFALVLLLTGLAAGTGWYFGAGPGALATVPETATLAPDSATLVLEEAGFTVEPGERHDPAVPIGQVSGTDPEAGAQARRGSVVTLFVSLGPQMLPLPDVVGRSEADARAALTDFTVAKENAQQFSADVAAGSVIAVLGADSNPVAAGADYPELAGLTLVVSVGEIPAVEGLPVGEAQGALQTAGVVVDFADPEFHDEIPVDHVITASYTNDPMHPGDTVVLTLSKGPDLVEVPNVVTGQTILQAREQLEELGFTVSSNVPGFLEGAVVASVQSPAAGEKLKRGSEVTVNFQP